MTTSRFLLLLAALGAALLPGCAAVTSIRGAAAPLDAYTLTPAPAARNVAASSRHIVVEPAVASGAIDTDRILVKPSPVQVQYLAGARWVDPVPELVQTLLTESLAKSGAFRHVGRTTVGPYPDYSLLTEVLDFQAEATGDEALPIHTRVTLSLALVREEDGTIVSSRQLTAVRAAPSLDPPTIVSAFNAATDDVLRQAVTWILSTLGLASS